MQKQELVSVLQAEGCAGSEACSPPGLSTSSQHMGGIGASLSPSAGWIPLLRGSQPPGSALPLSSPCS